MITVDNALFRILIPAGLTLALALGGSSWKQSLDNEHRITTTEAASSFQAKALDANIAKLLILEAKFDNILLSLGRIEGQLSMQGKVLPPTTKK